MTNESGEPRHLDDAPRTGIQPGTALCLSGGGFRAMLFHAGRYVASPISTCRCPGTSDPGVRHHQRRFSDCATIGSRYPGSPSASSAFSPATCPAGRTATDYERRDRRNTWEKTPFDGLRRNAIDHRTARRPARRLPIGVSKAASADLPIRKRVGAPARLRFEGSGRLR